MSVEDGGIRGAVTTPSISPAIGTGPLAELGNPAFGASNLLEGFGPKLGIESAFSIVNEGPVSFGELENTMTYKPGVFDLIGDLRFNPPSRINLAKPLDEQSAVAEANHWLGLDQLNLPTKLTLAEPKPSAEPLSEQAVLAEAEEILQTVKVLEFPTPKSLLSPAVTPIEIPLPSTDIIQIGRTKRALEVAGLTQLSTKVAGGVKIETGTASRQSISIATPQTQEQSVSQQLKKEEVGASEETEENLEVLEDEEVEELVAKYLVDEEVSEERRIEIRHAVRLAKIEAEKEGVVEIEGWRIVKHLPEHAGIRSQVVKKNGPDGSFDETLEEIVARKFTSEQEAIEKSDSIVFQKQPVKRGRHGTIVPFEAVAKVFKRHLVKKHPSKEVIARIVKKQQVQQVKGQPAILSLLRRWKRG